VGRLVGTWGGRIGGLQAGILISEGAVEVAGLEETNEAAVDGRVRVGVTTVYVGCLIGLVHVLPVVGAGEILLSISGLP